MASPAARRQSVKSPRCRPGGTVTYIRQEPPPTKLRLSSCWHSVRLNHTRSCRPRRTFPFEHASVILPRQGHPAHHHAPGVLAPSPGSAFCFGRRYSRVLRHARTTTPGCYPGQGGTCSFFGITGHCLVHGPATATATCRWLPGRVMRCHDSSHACLDRHPGLVGLICPGFGNSLSVGAPTTSLLQGPCVIAGSCLHPRASWRRLTSRPVCTEIHDSRRDRHAHA